MRNRPNQSIYIFATLALVVFGGSSKLFAQKTDGIHCSFTRTDTTYSFLGRFEIVNGTDGDIGCVLPICFAFNHVKALSPEATNVELIDQGENWNTISFVYGIFSNYENESTWYRVVYPDKNRVDFTLIASVNSHAIMPEMISSSGYYLINLSNDTIIVEYYQQCLLSESLITDIYLYTVKKRAVEFMYLFKDYLIKHCKVNF